jgi:TolB-like protein
MSISQVDAGGENAGIDLTRGTQAGGVATAVKLGFARVGVAVKTVTDTVVGDRASSVAADVGVSAEWNLLSASVAYRNLGGALRTGNAIDAPDEVLPAELRGGLALRYPGRPIVVAAEAAQVAGLKGRVAVGVEWWPVAAFGIRAGTADLGEAVARITAGLSASWKGVALDYARVSHPVGVTHTASLSFAFGPTSSELANSQASARTAREAELAAAPAPVESAPAVVPEAALPVAATPTPAPRPSGRSTLAVAAFDPQNVSAGDAAVIADMFRAELVKQGRFDIIEKVNMDKILAEQAFQQSGCTTAECAVKLGKILNVRYLIVGSFGKLMDQYVLNIRMVETESAKVIYSDAVGELSTQRAVQKAIAAMTTRLGKAYGSK